MKNIALIFCFILAFSVQSIAFAQDKDESTDFTAGSDIFFHTDQNNDAEGANLRLKTDDAEEITVIEDKYAGEYAQPTLDNISKLYWKKGVLKENNNTAIDNFLMIHECDIYKKFYTDDFEWERIREAGREMIKENKDSFPNKFKMIVPIDLGRYDMMRKGFPLINKTAFKDLRRVEIGGNSNSEPVCDKTKIIEHYPRNLILILNKPFSYEFVELDEHIAQAFIVRQKYDKINRPKELENESFDRLAFARFRITFSDYQGETVDSGGYPLGIMFGKLDGIDIFEDAKETRLLTSLEYK